MCLLGVSQAWAEPHYYFQQSGVVLNVGTTSFNFMSNSLLSTGFSGGASTEIWNEGNDGWVVFDGNGNITWPEPGSENKGVYRSPFNIIDLGSSKFGSVVEGATIRINVRDLGNGANLWFYEHGQTYSYPPLDNVKTYNSNNSCYEAVITGDAVNYLKTQGLNIHAQALTIKSMEIIAPAAASASSFDWTAKPCGDISITGGASGPNNGVYTLDPSNSTISFTGGGAIVIIAEGKQNTTAAGYRAYYVVTVPYEGNHIWNFEDFDHTGSITSDRGSVTPNQNAIWTDIWKSMSSQGNNHEIRVATPNESAQDGYSSIDGTNAYYIPETEGLLFYTNPQNFGFNGRDFNGSKKFVTWGGRYAHDDSGYNPTFKIPQVQGGKYIKVWWNGMSEGGLGANFQVENLLDLEGVEITNQFNVTGVVWNTAGTQYLGGVVIFKVKGAPSERKDVVFKLKDTGWNDIYRIEITDVYSTDMILKQQVGYDYPNYKEVLYTNNEGNIVIAPNEMNVEHKRVQELVAGSAPTAWPIKSYMGDGNSLIERAQTCRWDVVQEPNNIIEWEEREWISARGVHYWNLDITKVKGTGNIKIIQKVTYGSSKYVLDKKETWIAIGTYKKQSYPYTWDFMDWNMKQTELYSSLDASDNYGVTYGYWKQEGDEKYSLETHELVNGTIYNGYTEQYEKIDKPLFAQGAQLSYRKANGIERIAEAEGLRIKQFWGGELGVGSTYDGEITLDGQCLDFTPTTGNVSDGHKLVITIPSIPMTSGKEMWVFVKATDKPNSVYAATDLGKTGAVALTLGTPDKCNLEDDVWAYKVTKAGDVEILYSKNASIKLIGVTNIFKSINALGYATESRDVDIDHEYEGKFTKNDVNAYGVQAYDNNPIEENRTVYVYKGYPEVKKTGRLHLVPKNTGIVLYADADKNPSLGAQFNVPLFYPACNAKITTTEKESLENNWMAPWVEEDEHDSETIGKDYAMHKFDDDGESYNTDEKRGEICTKFVMSRQYYVYNKTYDSNSGLQQDRMEVEAFYRMRLNSGANEASNTMGANKAYLLIPTCELPTALWANSSNGGNAKPGVIYMDLEDLFGGEEPVSGIATGIENIDSAETIDNGNTFHTLSGMQIQGVPTQKGVYIVNGKKVLVK